MSDVDALMDIVFADADEGMAAYISEFKPAFQTLINKYTNSLAYEIVSTEKTDDGYAFSVSMTLPDAEDFNEELSDALNEVANEDTMNKLLISLLASGTITQNSSEDEIMAAAMTEYVKLMTNAISDIDIDVIDEDASFVVKELDGKWLIIADESDF